MPKSSVNCSQLNSLLKKIRACTLCRDCLPHKPNPVIQANANAKILIIGQAPGSKVHHSGIPWNDRSGDRLREWLELDSSTFYDEQRIAIIPMGFCYPGIDKNGGDKPPRKECAPLWHPQLHPLLSNIQLTLLVGSYAQRFYLKESMKTGMSETVFAYRDYLPSYFPLPHPSWRNTGWLRKNPWFELELLPELRSRLQAFLF